MRLSRCAGSPEPSLYTCMISSSISIAGTNTVASPFEQKNRKTTQSNDLELETIEMVGIFLFIWYSDVQYASIFILL